MGSTIRWRRRNGYEVSSVGDKRFSALNARFPFDIYGGRTIEEVYQCDIKGYDPNGTNWRAGKGKPPLQPISPELLWELYLGLWMRWSFFNLDLMRELYTAVTVNDNNHLSDCFASTDINQAHALSEILNDLIKHRGPNPNDSRYFLPKTFRN